MTDCDSFIFTTFLYRNTPVEVYILLDYMAECLVLVFKAGKNVEEGCSSRENP